MIKLKIVRAQKAVFPGLELPQAVLEDVAKVAEASILDNIRRQKQADGSALESNRQSTMEAKRRKGRPVMSLVDALHRFVRGSSISWASTIYRRRATVIIEPATGELRNLVRWVQEGGDGRNRYTGWFGINKEARAAIRERLRQWVRDEFRKARRRQR